MFPAFLTTLFFGISVIFAARSSRLLGINLANLGRMLIALLLLGAWAHRFGEGLAGRSFWTFFLSGSIGFGFGDLALFLALARLGPRLTILLAQCLAAPLGALIEWLWLGTQLRPAQLFCGALILLGVALALAPQRHVDLHRRTISMGILFGVLAALGQALGAVISRKASLIAQLDGLPIDGGTAAYQRMLGGIFITLIFVLATGCLRADFARLRQHAGPGFFWITLHALAGPTIGVSCYQWALATTPTGIVLPIVAAAPIVTIPLAWWIDGDRPSLRSILGGILAVAGTIALTQA